MTSNRQSNIECLRVFSMYLIIVGHVIGNASSVIKSPAIDSLIGGGQRIKFQHIRTIMDYLSHCSQLLCDDFRLLSHREI